MLWQYRTSLFEFTKDGLLGDKYVDDEEMEKSLNELGKQEWELVSVSLLQDGLLAFLKRPLHEDNDTVEQPQDFEPVAVPVVPKRSGFFSRNVGIDEKIEEEEHVQEEEREPVRNFDRQRNSVAQKEEKDFVGDIKIS